MDNDNDNTRALMATIDRLVAERDAAERRESELGLQVVAQAARLRLADGLAASVRCFLLGCDDQMSSPPPSLDAALAAWDAVPGAT